MSNLERSPPEYATTQPSSFAEIYVLEADCERPWGEVAQLARSLLAEDSIVTADHVLLQCIALRGAVRNKLKVWAGDETIPPADLKTIHRTVLVNTLRM